MDHHQKEMPIKEVVPKATITCPKCRRGLLEDRVPRSFLVKTFLGFLPLRRYICYRCFRKSYKWYSGK